LIMEKSFGFSLLEKKEFLSWINYVKKWDTFEKDSSKVIPIYKGSEKIVSSVQDYEDVLGIEYLPFLKYASPKVLFWIEKKCKKADENNLITKGQKWLGTFYDKELSSYFLPNLSIRFIDDQIGYGVFAESDLKPNTFIGEYTGLLRKREKRRDQKNSYCFEYLIGETIDTPLTIDARDQGNHTRFINHANDANCDLILIFNYEVMKIIIYTNRFVSKGEQITYDYGTDYWRKREDLQDLPS